MDYTWDDMYREVPPWDIGRPQPELVRLQASGALPSGALLDAGCGTGENALFFAAKGYTVLGIDLVARALELARRKAHDRGIVAEFRKANALELSQLQRTFDVVIDSGLFHTFSDEERSAYLSGVAGVLRPGGAYVMMCFSDREPTDWGGPRRVRRDEIVDSFAPFLKIEILREARFATRMHDAAGGFAWLTLARRAKRAKSRRSAPSRRPRATR